MIIYYSGNGNSYHIACRLEEYLDEQIVKLTDTHPEDIAFDGERFILVFPVYSWGVPPVVRKFLSQLNSHFIQDAKKCNKCYVVCTCGDDVGLLERMVREDLKKLGLELRGLWSVTMPNTYVLLPGFNVDSEELETLKINLSETRIKEISGEIKENKRKVDVKKGKFAWIKTSLIYPFFMKYLMCKREKWHYEKSCIHCGKCRDVCPNHNIKLINGSPEWGNNCLTCLGCFHACPSNAIQYGKATKDKKQYKSPFLR